MQLSFDGQLAVVTGGASGIGLATAQAFQAAGAEVVILDVNMSAALPPALAGRVRHADLLRPETVVEAIDAVAAEFGRPPDVFVNSAGAVFPARLLDMDLDLWRRTIDLNLTGTFVGCQAVARRMVKAGRAGSIVCISSMAGFSGISTRAAYAAAKAGVISLTKSMAVEWGEHGIRVNAVAPGAVQTPLTALAHTGDNAPLLEGILRRAPLGRYGTPEEVAGLVLFLAHPHAAYITGETVVVDGGFTPTGVRF